jgi:malic enzyme
VINLKLYQANNAYIFPGFGLGEVISGAIRVTDDMVLAAGKHNLNNSVGSFRLLRDTVLNY